MQGSVETVRCDPRDSKPGFHSNNFRLAMMPASISASAKPAVAETPSRGESKPAGPESSLALQPSLSLGTPLTAEGGQLISLMTSVFATLKEENTELHKKVKILQEKNRDLNDENKRLKLRRYRDYFIYHQSSGKRGRDFDRFSERQRSESTESDGLSSSSDERRGRHSELTRRKRKDRTARSSSNGSSFSLSSETSWKSNRRLNLKVPQIDASPKTNPRNLKRSRRDHESRKVTPPLVDRRARSPEKEHRRSTPRQVVPNNHDRSSQPSFRNSSYNPGKFRKPWDKRSKQESSNQRFANWSRPKGYRPAQSWKRIQTLSNHQDQEEKDNPNKPFFNPFSYKSPDKLKQ